MNYSKLKEYCQFCLNLQTKNDLKIPINRKIKQDYFDITQKKLNTKTFSEFICCQPCYEELNSVVSFRLKLLDNQVELEKLYNEKSEPKQILFEEVVDESDFIKTDIEGEEMQIEYIEEHLELIEDEEFTETSIKEENETHLLLEMDDSSMKKKKYQRKRLKEAIKCPKCDKLFYYKSYFAFHYKDVHQNHCEVCEVCGKIFKNNRRLNSHMLVHNVGQKRFKCETCCKDFNYSGDLLRHKRVHDNIKPYVCHFKDCGKSFVQSYALKLHLDVHNHIRYSCDSCGAEFSVKTTLKNHMLKCLTGTLNCRPSRYRSTTKESNRERYKCFINDCDREFSSRKYLGVHLEKNHQMKFSNFETTCLCCQMAFDNIGDYAKHVKIHSCNFVCEMCKLRFKTEEKLQTHIEKLHKDGDNRPYLCEAQDCGAKFKRMEHLKGHELYKHSDIKKFECSECSLKFRQRGEYNVHMRVHQNIKPFSCWKCDHVCKTSSNLRQHMRLVHNGEDKIYFCDICRITFKYNVDLTQHKKDHQKTVHFEIVEINGIINDT